MILPKAQATRVRRALSSTHTLEAYEATDGNLRVRAHAADAIIVDPVVVALGHTRFPRWVTEARNKVIAYPSATKESIRAALEAVRVGIPAVVLQGYDDSDRELNRQVVAARSRSLAKGAVAAVSKNLTRLPHRLCEALTRVIESPAEYATAEDVCRDSGTPRRSCDRWMREVGLCPVAHLIRGSRALHAVPLLRAAEVSRDTVAVSIGVGSARQVGALARAVFGVPPAGLKQLRDDELVKRFKEFVVVSR
jgi:hypothetical protein